MSKRAVAVVCGLVVLGGVLAWALSRGGDGVAPSPDDGDRTQEPDGDDPDGAGSEAAATDGDPDPEALERALAAERRKKQRAQADAARTRDELARTEQELEAAKAAAAQAAAPPAVEPWRERLAGYPVYEVEGLAESLDAVDWTAIGENMAKMPPLIGELAGFIAEGRPLTELPPETIGTIQKHNAPLVTAAITIKQKNLPGTGINGAFSHPAFMANAMAATLEAVGTPLDPGQSASLGRLAADYSQRDEARRAGYGDDVSDLRKMCDEAALKHDYFEAAYGVFTPEQHLALRPEAVRGRIQLDLFNECLLWTGRVAPVEFSGDAQLQTLVADWLINRGSLAAASREPAAEVIAAWVEATSPGVFDERMDTLSRQGMMRAETVTAFGYAVADLLERLIADLELGEAGAKSLRAVPGTIVMYRKSTDGEPQ